ncbi:MAG: L,D-transpeptidase family protein [Alphaproteobacteria bacterium]
MAAIFVAVSFTYPAYLSRAYATDQAVSNSLVKQLISPEGDNARDLAALSKFYAERDMQPLWVADSRVTERGLDVVHVISDAEFDGLTPDDYGLGAIEALLPSTESDDLAELDLRLSLGLIQLVSDLGSGRTEPAEVDPELFVYPQDIDKQNVIREAANAADIGVFVAGYRPRHIDYWRLKGKLADYRAIAKAGGWGGVEPGPLLEVGMTNSRVGQLRMRLRRTGHLPAPRDSVANPHVFDQALVAAVMDFQIRHGLKPDGKVGQKTLAAINVPVEVRIEQIALNLERRRWTPDDVGARYISVNLADFSLKLIERGRAVLDMPVVIGSRYNRTPVFSADMTYLVMNPYWNVPPSIATTELLQKMRADPDYLQDQGFELFSDWTAEAKLLDPRSIDWQDVTPNRFPYKIRQRPGPNNALGRLKFMLPNEFDIYLHDTPEREHFARSQRSFSHGCIRVADPERLAAALLDTQPEWALDQIKSTIAGGDRQVVALERSLPVDITYLTAWVDENNNIHFRDDVYGRDAMLANALNVQQTWPGAVSAELESGQKTQIIQ